jgi:hypothetical protein
MDRHKPKTLLQIAPKPHELLMAQPSGEKSILKMLLLKVTQRVDLDQANAASARAQAPSHSQDF